MRTINVTLEGEQFDEVIAAKDKHDLTWVEFILASAELLDEADEVTVERADSNTTSSGTETADA